MKTSIIPQSQAQSREQPRLIDLIARRGVITLLSRLQKGHIQLIDGQQMYDFGQPDAALKTVVTVRNPSFYSSIAFAGSTGAGEAYFHGDWDCDNLTSLVRILVINRQLLDSMDSGPGKLMAPLNKLLHWFNRNSRLGSRRNIAAHYDIGNSLFELMLDSNMMYSSAVYSEHHNTLELAATHKLDLICQKLKLDENDQVIEIGTGWGGFAIHAARHYGCHVTTTTISQQQYNYARQRIKQLGLEHKITLLQQDYRDLTGQYDKLVSIEMIEAVGQENLDNYFGKCCELLKTDGMMCIQAITIADQRYSQALREVDFIQKYIFPGGSLPSITAMAESLTCSTDMVIYQLDDIGADYARTLRDWRERFFQHESQIRELGYNEAFIRLWEFYLCYCEGGFMERAISTVHLLATRPDFRQT
ncbi:MAG TPA: cyclopropane-fatty-acyl-phospholipid synthase family protein [Gammaproteobacteria bacterium]